MTKSNRSVNVSRLLTAVVLSASAAACGGGGGSSTPEPAPVTAPAAPAVNAFTATPASVNLGQTVTLGWQVTGATAITIDQGVGAVTGTSVLVAPALGDTTYELTASNGTGSASGVVSVSVAGGGDAGTPIGAPAAGYTERSVAPSTAAGGLSDSFGNHVAAAPNGARVNRLFVHLVGTGGKPPSTVLVLREAATQGLHAIGLAYPNVPSVDSLCSSSSDAACHEKVRLEIIDGTDRTPLVAVDRANSIENRLATALTYLARQYPAEGWGQYLSNGVPAWGSVAISGHSQGGGHAAIMARDRVMARVCMFGSPGDRSNAFNAPAAWLTAPHATPTERYYGFTHQQDSQANTLRNWAALGMASLGAPVNVDSVGPPYVNSHQLTTNAVPALAGEYHGSVVVDRTTPLGVDGRAVFAPVWRQMCFS